MKHTTLSLESLADRFLFAAHSNLVDIIVAMTDELHAASKQCEDLTSMTWTQFLKQRDDLIQAGRLSLAEREIVLLLSMPNGVRCHACGFIAPAPCFRPGRGRSFGEHPEHRYCPRCHKSITWHGFLTTAIVLARNGSLNKATREK